MKTPLFLSLIFFNLLGNPTWAKTEGIRFACAPEELQKIAREMRKLLEDYNLPSSLILRTGKPSERSLTYTLDTPTRETDTLTLYQQPHLHIEDEKILLPIANGRTREVSIVSKKEILLALLQHGRLTVFKRSSCSVDALKDHIGVRQSIAAWAQDVKFGWPEDFPGGHAFWNKEFWKDGTPHKEIAPHIALNDVFMSPKKYAVGCTTASKITVAQGILDYYGRVKNDSKMRDYLNKRLLVDGDPLVDISSEINGASISHHGKLLTENFNTSYDNWVPGDWGYFKNMEPKSANKTGYEGSNSIYLGRDQFDDYYHEHGGHYSFREKLIEIYQWRDKKLQGPITEKLLADMGRNQEEGGIIDNSRSVPYVDMSHLPKWVPNPE